jgi:hypothetical protein
MAFAIHRARTGASVRRRGRVWKGRFVGCGGISITCTGPVGKAKSSRDVGHYCIYANGRWSYDIRNHSVFSIRMTAISAIKDMQCEESFLDLWSAELRAIDQGGGGPGRGHTSPSTFIKARSVGTPVRKILSKCSSNPVLMIYDG